MAGRTISSLRTLLRCHQAQAVSSVQSASAARTIGVRCFSSAAIDDTHKNWVFLGAPGVGKGTYSTRIAGLLGVEHIAAGDLVRAEIKKGTEMGKKMAEISNSGRLLGDDIILGLIKNKLNENVVSGKKGFVLDGFPRTHVQAEALGKLVTIHKAVNLTLREQVLVEKCLGRRICSECGKNYNVADIFLAASGTSPEIVMPPLNPPEKCKDKMTIRADDTEEVVKRRLDVYKAEATPVENFYREQGILIDFEITGGIPETLPKLKAVLLGEK